MGGPVIVSNLTCNAFNCYLTNLSVFYLPCHSQSHSTLLKLSRTL